MLLMSKQTLWLLLLKEFLEIVSKIPSSKVNLLFQKRTKRNYFEKVKALEALKIWTIFATSINPLNVSVALI